MENHVRGTTSHIPIEELCRNIMKGTVLDIFFLIQKFDYIFKSEILRKFVEYDEDPKCSPAKYRLIMDVGIAKLEGAGFISFFKEGNKERYYLTPYGKVAGDIVPDLVDEDPSILYGSKITLKVAEGK